jgi:hypothetical protein
MEKRQEKVLIDGRVYNITVIRKTCADLSAPRLVIPAYQPNSKAKEILRVCIEGIQRYTDKGTYELWVVDNNSPRNNAEWLVDQPGINLVLSRTKPVPRERRGLRTPLSFLISQEAWGSYANAVGLELGRSAIDPDSRYLMTLHMDTTPFHTNWLEYLKSQIHGKTVAAGVCLEKNRTPEGVLHILGAMIDFQRLKEERLDFMPHLPNYDVGDEITVGFRRAGYDVFACRNTYENPEYSENIPPYFLARSLNVMRVFDDEWNVIFMHLARGLPKASDRYPGRTTSVDDWINVLDKEFAVETHEKAGQIQQRA